MVVPDAADFGTESDVIRASAGDRDAFARLILSHKETLYRVAMSYVGHVQDAEDAISETILKAFRSVGKLRNGAYFRTWLVRILINECKDTLKRRKRGPESAAVEPTEHDSRLDGVDLFETVMLLPEDTRTAAVLYYYEDMTGEEISKMLGVNPVTVRTRLSRARNQLKEMLRLEES